MALQFMKNLIASQLDCLRNQELFSALDCLRNQELFSALDCLRNRESKVTGYPCLRCMQLLLYFCTTKLCSANAIENQRLPVTPAYVVCSYPCRQDRLGFFQHKQTASMSASTPKMDCYCSSYSQLLY